jgi:catechol 2,3-dioxygenase-like lactoylglutathione lyase family enzyme
LNYHREQSRYVDSTEQLVTEIVVRDIKRSTRFYRELGFRVVRDAGDFVELSWEDHLLFMAEVSAYHEVNSEDIKLPELLSFPLANIRIMVPNVDAYWKLVKEMGAQIIIPVADRYYGLRDFIVSDPDGFGLRFATPLQRENS